MAVWHRKERIGTAGQTTQKAGDGQQPRTGIGPRAARSGTAALAPFVDHDMWDEGTGPRKENRRTGLGVAAARKAEWWS